MTARRLAVLLLALCVPPSAVFGESESSLELRDTRLTETERVQRAEAWGLRIEEWQRYETLMQGQRGLWSPELDPILVLGIHARSDDERRRYAELAVEQERTRVAGELAFQRAYDAAWQRLYPDELMIDMPASARNGPRDSAVPEGGGNTRRVLLFTRTTECPACDALLPDVLARARALQAGLDIFLLDTGPGDEAACAPGRQSRGFRSSACVRGRSRSTTTKGRPRGSGSGRRRRPWRCRRREGCVRSISRNCASGIGAVTLIGALGGAAGDTVAAIPPAYVEAAQAYAVPPEILFAVALAESELLLTSNRVMPWPWTLNVEGEEERYRNRLETWEAISRHLAKGRRSIDIGLMQVNWRWHRERLRDPWTALDPQFNLRAGASILHELYQEDGDWVTAIGRYHAPAGTLAARQRAAAYRARVLERLERLQP